MKNTTITKSFVNLLFWTCQGYEKKQVLQHYKKALTTIQRQRQQQQLLLYNIYSSKKNKI